jgi:HK97 family phage major capsid protein
MQDQYFGERVNHTMKKKLMELLAKKEARKSEISTKANASEDVKELRGIASEMEQINSEIAELRSVIASMPDETPAAPAAPAQRPEARSTEDMEEPQTRGSAPVGAPAILASYGARSARDNAPEDMDKESEQRGADLKAGKLIRCDPFMLLPERRATTVGGATLVSPTRYGNSLAESFGQVSSMIDVVNAIPLMGGESYKHGFVVGYGEGAVTTETGNYTETDPTFSYVDIVKSKITAYAEITDEARKLTNVNYQAYVQKNIAIALRKTISKAIVSGAGGANVFTGIFNAPTNVMPTAKNLEISEIDEDTLDSIVFGFGGDEDVEDVATLILSKADLAAFAAIRGTDGKKLYKIVTNGNTGTISSDGSFSVRYIINSACPGFETASVGDYVMAYGYPLNYIMPVFSQIEIEESRDYKFRTGQVAYRGSVWAGGNVGVYNGFTRIKKVAP